MHVYVYITLARVSFGSSPSIFPNLSSIRSHSLSLGSSFDAKSTNLFDLQGKGSMDNLLGCEKNGTINLKSEEFIEVVGGNESPSISNKKSKLSSLTEIYKH